MANATVKASLKYSDGTAAKGVAVKAIRQSDPLLSATLATADIIDTTADPNSGIVTLTLPISSTNPVAYKIIFCDGQYIYLNLPKNALSCNLGIITVSAGPSQTKKNITGLFTPTFVGADIASAAAIAPTCSYHKVTGTTTITSITATDYPVGQPLTLMFNGSLTFTKGSNLKISASLASAQYDTITLVSDGTNFYEVGRSVAA